MCIYCVMFSEQKTSGECDVITGVHVLDGKFHLLLLEGLRSGAITQLFEHIQAKSGKIISVFNSYAFSCGKLNEDGIYNFSRLTTSNKII